MAVRILAIFGVVVCVMGVQAAMSTLQPADYMAWAQVRDTFDVQDEIFIQRRYGEEITQLKDLYRDQMQAYRTAEREFQIAKGHHNTVDTLASLENLVKASNKVFIARDKAIITYLELMRAVTLETDGIELTLKNLALDKIDARLTEMKNHLMQAEIATDKPSIDVAADSFNELFILVEADAHFAMTLIMLGDIQEVFDKAVLIQRDIRLLAAETEMSALQQAEFVRAMEEIDRTAQDIRQDFQNILAFLNKDKDRFKATDYREYQRRLSQAHTKVSRLVSFVSEAHKISR